MQTKNRRRLFLETLEPRIVLTGQIPAVTIDGLVSWYQAEDLASDSANGNPGTLEGGATTVPDGMVGDAFRINYSPTRVEIPDHPSLRLQAFTIDAWVFANSLGSIANDPGAEIIGKDLPGASLSSAVSSLSILGPDTHGKFTFAASYGVPGQPSFNQESFPSLGGFGLGEWHHVAMISDGSTIRGYVDGDVQTTGFITLQSPIAYNSSPWTIGGHAGLSFGYANRFYDGLIDEVGFYQRALTEAQLKVIDDHGSQGRYAIPAGQQFTLPGAFSDADSSSWTASVNYGDGSDVEALALDPDDHTFLMSHVFSSTGTYTITAAITDDTGNTTPHSLVVNVTVPTNTAPAAGDDAWSVNQDESLIVTGEGVLENDTDAQNNLLSAALVSDTSHGELTLNSDGSFTYIPEAGYFGFDDFTYRASDGTLLSNVATVTITVVQPPVNQLPAICTLELDQHSIVEDGSVLLSGTVSDADSADTHNVSIDWGDGSTLQVVSVDSETHAFSAAHLYADDNPTSTPADDYQISVIATDNHGGDSLAAEETVTVSNADPDVDPISGPAGGVQGQSLAFTGSFSDAAADSHTFAWQAVNSSGVVVATGSGPGFSFVPSTSGSYTVELTVTDDDSGTAIVTKAVNVASVQMLPDPDRLGMTMLVVGGTTGNDTFTLTPTSNPGNYRLNLNGLNLGVYAPTGSFQIYGGSGDDTLVLNGNSLSNAFEIHPDYLVLNALPIYGHDIATRQINALGSGDTITAYGGSATIDGGAASDTLVATGAISHDWLITGQNAGSLDGLIFFSQVEQLVGGAGADTFHLAENARITGSMNGGGGSDLLIGPDSATIWKIQSVNAGIVKNSIFSGFETLQSGGGDDVFRILPGAAFAGSLEAGEGTDTLDYSAYTSAVEVNFVQHVTTGLGGVSGFENITGGSGNDFLVGNEAGNVISGGAGSDIILGWSGDDILSGNAGMDILVGGLGIDIVHGNNTDDILVGGSLSYANELNSNINWAALDWIMAEWRRELSYQLRIGHLNVDSTDGFNHEFMLNSDTVLDDGAIDTLYGDSGQDWFLAGSNDDVKTTKAEVVTE